MQSRAIYIKITIDSALMQFTDKFVPLHTKGDNYACLRTLQPSKHRLHYGKSFP